MRQPPCAGDAAQVAFDQRDAGALHRHVGAGAHRDADVGGGQRGRIVDAVAGHRDDAALRAQALHHLLLLRRHDVGLERVQPQLGGHRLRGGSAVAGEHDHAHALVAQRLQRLLRGGLDRIGDSEKPGGLAVDGDEENGLSLGAQDLRAASQSRGIGAHFGKKPGASHRHRVAANRSGDAVSRDTAEVRGGCESCAALLGGLDDGVTERVLAGAFQAGSEAEHLTLLEGADGLDEHQPRLSLGQGAGLVHQKGVHLFQQLERLGVADEHARRGAPARPDHDAHRRGQPERARAGNDQHRHGVDERVRKARLGAEQYPGGERRGRDRDDRGNEPGRDGVGQSLDGRARALGLAHHADDLREQGLAADALRAHDEAAGAVHRCPGHLVGRLLLDGNRLAGHHRFVDAGRPFQDDAVHRHLLARPHAKPVAMLDLIERLVALGAIVEDKPRDLGREPEQRLQRAARPAAGAQLQHLAKKHQRDDDRGRLEVERDLAAMAADARRQEPGQERGDDAEAVGDAGADADQREHVEPPRLDRGPPALEERKAGPGHDRRRERELDPGEPASQSALHRHSRNQIAHGQEEHRHAEEEAHPEAPGHVYQLRVAIFGAQ